MSIDFDKYDGQILLSAEKRRGIWATNTVLRGSRAIKTAGRLPTVATAHTLLVVALISALRNITRAQAEELVSSSNLGIRKARIKVVTTDEAFVAALTAMLKRQKNGTPPLRAAKNFLIELARQLVRFDVTLEAANRKSARHRTLKNWSVTTAFDPKAFETISPVLLPTLVSAVS